MNFVRLKKLTFIKVMLTIFILCFLMGCTQNSEYEVQKSKIDDSGKEINETARETFEEMHIKKTVYSLNDVMLIGQIGKQPDDYKLSFLKSDCTQGVTCYGMCYSTESATQVIKYLETLNKSQLESLVADQKLYLIKRLEWADGGGNTFRCGQQDIINGGVMNKPGEYKFYAFTAGDDGVLGFAEADRTVTITPFAKNLLVDKEGSILNVSFESYDDKVIAYNIFMISKTNIDDVNMRIGMLTRNEIAKLCETDKVVKYENHRVVTSQVDLSKMKDIYGSNYDRNGLYYAFIGSVGTDGKILGITKSPAMIFPETMPETIGVMKTGIGNGTVFPNGGAASTVPLSKEVLGYLKSILGGRPRVAVISASWGTESENYEDFPNVSDMFKQVGMDAIYIPLNTDNFRSVADEEYMIKLVSSCHGVYFAGGNQAKISRVTHNDDGSLNDIGNAIIDIIKKGGFAVGTSAGCNIMSDPMYLDGTSNEVIALNRTDRCDIGTCESSIPSIDTAVSVQGLPLIEAVSEKTVLMDSHFDARSRLGRMLVTMRDNNIDIGIGCDEATGISINKGLGTVYGNNAVFIVDCSDAIFSSKEDEKFTVRGVKLNYLTVGDQYNLKNNLVMPRNKYAAETIESDWITDDIFNYNGYNVTRALITTAFGSSNTQEFGISGTDLKFVLTKHNNTKVSSGDGKLIISKLQDYPLCTIANMELCIK